MAYARHEVGKFGERVVARYFAHKGFRIVVRNWRCRYGEIDIVCTDGIDLFIIEVKTRTSNFFGLPEEAVHASKYARLRRTVHAFLNEHPGRYRQVRMVVASVQVQQQAIILRLYTDI